MKKVAFWSRKLFRRTVQQVGRSFYINPHPALGKTILVAGTARSGTTWLGDLITSEIPCRTLFEPFNPDLVPLYRNFNYFQYMRSSDENPEFYAFAEKVLTGAVRNAWIDRYNERIFSQYRLVKEIRINLALKWLHDHFPQVPIVFLMRHPCAVVLSRLELGWATDQDIKNFLSQPDLIEDYLGDTLDLIHQAKTDVEKHAIIWSVTNLVPLKQLNPRDYHLVFYEDLCTQTDATLSAVFKSIGYQAKENLKFNVNRPSSTARETSPVVSGTDKISHWTKHLNPSQIHQIMQVVEAFGLIEWYDESVQPKKHEVQTVE
jgi:hypothetical protein